MVDRVSNLPTDLDNMKLLTEDYVFDLDKSVSWNKLQMNEHNLEYQIDMKSSNLLESLRLMSGKSL